MGKKKENKVSEKKRSRSFMVLLYPDNAEHCQALEIIKQSYDYAVILHNRDVTTEGEQKKEHWHVVLRFKDGVWNTAVAKNLGIEVRFIEDVKNINNSLLYLLHWKDTVKEQYNLDEVQGTLKQKLEKLVNKEIKDEGDRVIELIAYLDTKKDKYITIKDFAIYCAEIGYWAEFRRSATIFLKIIDEHNSKVIR